MRLATLLAPGGPGAAPEALDLQQTLRQHWAAGRLAERCRQHGAAAAHFEAVVRLCTESGDAPTEDAAAHQAGEAVEHAREQAGGSVEAAGREQASAAAPVRRDAAGAQQAAKTGAEPALAQVHGQAEAAARTLEGSHSDGRPPARAVEVRVRAAGGGVESVISASEAAGRLEALQLHTLLEASLGLTVCQLQCTCLNWWQYHSGPAEHPHMGSTAPNSGRCTTGRDTQQGQTGTFYRHGEGGEAHSFLMMGM